MNCRERSSAREFTIDDEEGVEGVEVSGDAKGGDLTGCSDEDEAEAKVVNRRPGSRAAMLMPDRARGRPEKMSYTSRRM